MPGWAPWAWRRPGTRATFSTINSIMNTIIIIIIISSSSSSIITMMMIIIIIREVLFRGVGSLRLKQILSESSAYRVTICAVAA